MVLWAIGPILSWGFVLIGLVAGAVLWEQARSWLAAAAALTVLVALFNAIVQPGIRYRVHRWEVTEHAVYSLSGWLVREWRVAPISRVQTVDAVRGPLEQLLGLATLRVTTASSAGTIAITGLDADATAHLVEQLTAITQATRGDAT